MKRLLLILAAWLALALPVWATTQTETLNWSASTAGATTTVTTTFQYEAVIFTSHCKTTEGETAAEAWSIGPSDGTNHRSIASAGDDAVATSNVGRGWQTANALQCYSNGNPTNPVGGRITGVTFNPTNMVVTFNATPSSAWEISSIGIGGVDITNVFVGTGTMPTTSSVLNITAPGFQGNGVLIIAARATAPIDGTSTLMSLGFACSVSKRWAWTGAVQDGQTTSANVNGMSKIRDDKVLLVQNVVNADEAIADFAGFTANGYDLDFQTGNGNLAPASAYQFGYLVWKGGQCDCGVGTKPTGASAQNFSVAFTPRAMGWFMSSPTALNTYTSNAISTFGAWDGTSEVYAGGFHNDAINTVAKSAGGSTKVLCELNATACADGTTLGLTSTITWDATGTAFLTPWFAIGDNAAAGKTMAGGGTMTGGGTW